MPPKFYVVDTNVLLVAALPQHEKHSARQATINWLESLGRDSQSILIVDYVSPPGHSARQYLRPQFLPQIPFGTASSRILSEYHHKLDTTNPYMQII